jgi:hypothetical protein
MPISLTRENWVTVRAAAGWTNEQTYQTSVIAFGDKRGEAWTAPNGLVFVSASNGLLSGEAWQIWTEREMIELRNRATPHGIAGGRYSDQLHRESQAASRTAEAIMSAARVHATAWQQKAENLAEASREQEAEGRAARARAYEAEACRKGYHGDACEGGH